MWKYVLVFLIFLSAQCFGGNNSEAYRRPVDVVLCIDMSGSTTGITERLKESYFEIVNACNSLKPAPFVRIAIVAYARPSFLAATSYVKIYSDFTNDHDTVMMSLMRLVPYIEKGDQYVGAALNVCINQLSWSKDKNASKIICLVGNGLVNTGAVNYLDVCELAVQRKIVINTFYCMNSMYDKEIWGWRKISDATGGYQYEIDLPKTQLPFIAGSQETLHNLNNRFNDTYIYHSLEGMQSYNKMLIIDRFLEPFSQRAYQCWLQYKISEQGISLHGLWDLVSYSNTRSFDLMQINRNSLPDEYTNMVGAEMVKALKQKTSERQQLCTTMMDEIHKNDRALDPEVRKKNNQDDENFFTKSIILALMKTLGSQGFNIPEDLTGYNPK